MCNVAFGELYVTFGVGVLAPVHKRYLVVPPAEITPVRLQVLFELAVHFWVFTHSENNTVARDAWLLRSALVPLSFLIVEGSHRAGDVNNGAVLGTPVLLNNASQFSI